MQDDASWDQRFGDLQHRLGSGRGSLSLIKLALGPGTNLVEFGMQAPNFGVEFDKTEAWRSDQVVWPNAGIFLAPTRFQA